MHPARLLPACALALPLASQEVFVVDDDGGPGVFFDVYNALAAGADDGDVILVRDGEYGPFAIDGQGVAVIAEAGAAPRFGGEFFLPGYTAFPISGLAPGETLVLRGLVFERDQPIEQLDPLMTVSGGGTVWIEDCSLSRGGPSLLVGAGARVVLERSTVEGHAGFFNLFWEVPAGAALEVQGALDAHGSTATGGQGIKGSFGFPSISASPGAAGARVSGGGALNALASAFIGGKGGDGFAGFSCSGPGAGGAGVHLSAGGTVRSFEATFQGGAPGAAARECPAGSAGPGLLQEGGTLGLLAGPAPALAAGAVAREGQVLTATLQGEPGAFAFVAAGLAPAALFLAPLAGTLLVEGPVVFAVGPLPPSGLITLAAPVGELGPGVQAMLLPLQAAACGSGGCALGAGSVALLLDGAL